MNFEVYCDESGLEALTNKGAHLYTVIGSIWMPAENRPDLKEKLTIIKEKYNIKGELKWNKVSPAYQHLYHEVIDYFFEASYLRFRAILIETDKANMAAFHDNDVELGFYKFYYQLLHHWLFDNNRYNIFVDLKVNRNKGRLKELKKLLDEANRTSDILQVQGLPSEQSLGIQLADLLTGAVSAKFNGKISSNAKASVIGRIEDEHLKKAIAPTEKWEEKFNIFLINMEGGW
ncbi:MAG TPA: DUF3800 domain-containing protein [Cyclobacteriaceae bacterium]|jgi:hypothetical protein|nr:DUF3800 domain-containing protein [Cyclobacteriaceae bacterium]